MASLFLAQPDGSEMEIPLSQELIRIGRSAENEIQIYDDSASTFHAEMQWDGTRFHLKDCGSTNGVRVNGERITEAALSDGDLLRFGNVRARYTAPATEAVAEASTSDSVRPKAAATPKGTASMPSPSEPSTLAPLGFGAKKARKDPEKLIYMAVSALVVLASLGAIGMSFTMK